MMSSTAEQFWWGRFLSCWLFSGLLQCSVLSLWIFRMLDWLKCCIWICRDKSSIQIPGSKSQLWGSGELAKSKTGGWEWSRASSFCFECFLLVYWEQLGPLYPEYPCNCFRKPECVWEEIPLLFHSTFSLENVFVAFSKSAYSQSIYLEGKYFISGEHCNLQDYFGYKMYTSCMT